VTSIFLSLSLCLVLLFQAAGGFEVGHGSVRVSITETNRIHLVLFGMQNRTFGPCLAANNRILIRQRLCAEGLGNAEPKLTEYKRLHNASGSCGMLGGAKEVRLRAITGICSLPTVPRRLALARWQHFQGGLHGALIENLLGLTILLRLACPSFGSVATHRLSRKEQSQVLVHYEALHVSSSPRVLVLLHSSFALTALYPLQCQHTTSFP
jgi:hypothetical protein